MDSERRARAHARDWEGPLRARNRIADDDGDGNGMLVEGWLRFQRRIGAREANGVQGCVLNSSFGTRGRGAHGAGTEMDLKGKHSLASASAQNRRGLVAITRRQRAMWARSGAFVICAVAGVVAMSPATKLKSSSATTTRWESSALHA